MLQPLIAVIEKEVRSWEHAIVALSGGVDSALVAAAAHKALGDECVGVTVQSELTAQRDFTRAVEVAEYIGIEHHPLPMKVLGNEAVRCNDTYRCYHCKRSIFQMMRYEYGDHCLIMDGTNADDDPSRPGLKAVAEFQVLSPLKVAGYTKADVRKLARSIGLPNWNTPSESCLATRLASGTEIDEIGLQRVAVMEKFFHQQGVETLRAKHDNLMATVEYLPEYTEIMNKSRDKFATLIKKLGLQSFTFKEFVE